MRRPLTKLLLQAAPAIAVLVSWQMLVAIVPDYDFTIGSPFGILREFNTVIVEENLPRDIGVTMLEALLGFCAGTTIGTAVGLALWGSKTVYEITRPYLIALGSVPVFALGPALIFWFGTGIWSKVVLGFLVTFVIAAVQAHTGASEADPNLLRLIKAFGGTRLQAFFKIIIPSATIWVLSGIRINIGMALLGAFIGEFISSRMGLGYLIIVAEGLYNMNRIWVGVTCIVLIAIFFNWCLSPVEKWAKRWQ